jgi:hypothetical protein
LLELLGTGGQATVWLAEDRTLGSRVALKILPADADERTRGRWLEEVRQGRRLAHPNLIRIFDVVETSDRPVAVMEFVPGGTLADRVAADGAQPVEDVIRWAGEILAVLAYLHDNRVIHRDVKPSNLLVADDGSIKLSDLGLIRSLDRSSDLTRTLEGVGTPRFMSPEQLRGEKPTPSCDLYSLGVTLYQLLTGRVPFDGDSAFQIADGHLHTRPIGVREHRPECPRWLARFVERLLEKNPSARFRSAAGALAVLERQWVGISHRALGASVVATVLVMIAIVGVGLVRSTIRPSLDRVEIEGSEVVARSEEGRRLWSSDRPGLRPQVVRADVVGTREAEVVVGWSTIDPGENPEDSAFFEVYSESGEVIRSVSTEGWGREDFREFAPIWHLRELQKGNFTGDGDDLVWGLANPRWYPCIVGITSLRGSSDRPVAQLANSGHVQNMTVDDIDGDGRDDIAAIMVNNHMGFQRVLVTMRARSSLTGEACGFMKSPDIRAFLQARSTTPAGCVSFTPLGSNRLVVEAPRVVDGAIELVLDGEVQLFDRWGNAEESSLFGRGPETRESFWEDLATTCARLRLALVIDPSFTMDRLRTDHSEILSEAPTEVASYLVAAKALASGRHRDNAVALLRDGVLRHPDESDLQLRLGEQLLIGGEREEGREWAAASVNVAGNGRNHSDQVLMLILDAAVRGDVGAYEESRRFIANLSTGSENEFITFLDVAWFFFQGTWSDSRLIGADPGSVYRWVRVIQEWARFELSGDVAGGLKKASEFETTNEIRDLARVFEARVRLMDGDPKRSSQLADQALQSLSVACRDSFEPCVWVPLAEWVLGQALSSTEGREDEAEAVLAGAAERAPNTWIATPLTQ